jgi:hypothetical protein
MLNDFIDGFFDHGNSLLIAVDGQDVLLRNERRSWPYACRQCDQSVGATTIETDSHFLFPRTKKGPSSTINRSSRTGLKARGTTLVHGISRALIEMRRRSDMIRDANTPLGSNAPSRRSLLSTYRSVRPLRPNQRPASRPRSHHPELSLRACDVYFPRHRFEPAIRLLQGL